MKLLSLIIFGLVSVSLQQDTIGDGNQCVESCKDGEQEGLGDHCYYWSTARKSWDQSESDCKTRGGHLAAVTSLEIHNFLLKEVDKDDRDTWFWIGGSDKEQEGNWEWVDGSVWDFTIWADQPHQQQPEGGVNHGCLQIYNHHYAQNGWNDHRCDYYYPFICSWRICPATVPSDTTEAVPGTNHATTEEPAANQTNVLFDIMGVEVSLLAAVLLPAGVFVIVVLVTVVTCIACKRSKKKTEEEEMDVDDNTVYRTYELGENYERQYSINELFGVSFNLCINRSHHKDQEKKESRGVWGICCSWIESRAEKCSFYA